MIECNEQISQRETVLVKIDPDLEDLIPGYLRNREKDIKTMTDALETGNFDTIRILGHSMSGSGGGYGFERITDIGRYLEQSAKDLSPEEVRKGIKDLVEYLTRVEVIYG